MSIKRSLNKQKVVHPYSETLVNNRKKWATHRHNNMHEPKIIMLNEMLDQKTGNMVWFYSYELLDRNSSVAMQSRQVVASGAMGGRSGGVAGKGYKGRGWNLWWGNGCIHDHDCRDGFETILMAVNWSRCILYISAAYCVSITSHWRRKKIFKPQSEFYFRGKA